MPEKKTDLEIPVDKLRWRLDPATLPIETTEDLEPLKEIIGQQRGIEAFRFGMGMDKPGYNVFVTGMAGTGRMSTVRKLLEEISDKSGKVPDDLCYVNSFKEPEAPILLRLKAGVGSEFKKEVRDFVETLKKEIPQIFESQDYLMRKKEIMEKYDKKGKGFFRDLDKRVREEGFTLMDVQVGQIKRPEVMALVDGNPATIDQVEDMVEKGRFPKEEFEELKEKQSKLREEIDQIFLELRDLQKEIQQKMEEMDRLMFMKMATEFAKPIKEKYEDKKIEKYFDEMLEDMTENLKSFSASPSRVSPAFLWSFPKETPFSLTR